jgi:phosphoserine phosphatase
MSISQPIGQPIGQSITQSIAQSLTTRVILVRHGRSTFNEQGRYQGSSDEAVLTDSGVMGARQVGQWLQDQEIHAIYTSPLKRVQQTLSEMLANVASPTSTLVQASQHIRHDHRLREIDLPDWEGKSFREVRENYAEDYRCWKQMPQSFRMENLSDISPHNIGALKQKTGIFPVVDLYQRVQEFWQEILPRHLGQTILIVGHGGTNHALISTALGLEPSSHHRLQQSNCGISELHFPAGAQHRAKLHLLNLTTPLGETLPKLKEGKTGLRLLLVPIELSSSSKLLDISALLKDVKLDYLFFQDPEELCPDLECFLRQYDHTIQVRGSHSNLARMWQGDSFLGHNRQQSLVNGLVLADQAELLDFITVALAPHATDGSFRNSDEPLRLALNPYTMSILHYPDAEHPPILQALNYL